MLRGKAVVASMLCLVRPGAKVLFHPSFGPGFRSLGKFTNARVLDPARLLSSVVLGGHRSRDLRDAWFCGKMVKLSATQGDSHISVSFLQLGTDVLCQY